MRRLRLRRPTLRHYVFTAIYAFGVFVCWDDPTFAVWTGAFLVLLVIAASVSRFRKDRP